jgi:hypothetical protein
VSRTVLARLCKHAHFHQDSAILILAQNPPLFTSLTKSRAQKLPLHLAMRTLWPSYTRAHLGYKSLGLRSFIRPRAPLLGSISVSY